MKHDQRTYHAKPPSIKRSPGRMQGTPTGSLLHCWEIRRNRLWAIGKRLPDSCLVPYPQATVASHGDLCDTENGAFMFH